jgi:hypothetical protein
MAPGKETQPLEAYGEQSLEPTERARSDQPAHHHASPSDFNAPIEAALKRRARRQAFMLMILSSVISLLVIYAGWRLLSGRF